MEERLAELEQMLYGFNYQVFLRAYRVPLLPEARTEWYVAQALGSAAVLAGITSPDGDEVVTEVEEALRYVGDEGSGPDPTTLRSPHFNQLLSRLVGELQQRADRAALRTRFRIEDGHPAYPVFWDFGFVLAGPHEAVVLIGCSSD